MIVLLGAIFRDFLEDKDKTQENWLILKDIVLQSAIKVGPPETHGQGVLNFRRALFYGLAVLHPKFATLRKALNLHEISRQTDEGPWGKNLELILQHLLINQNNVGDSLPHFLQIIKSLPTQEHPETIKKELNGRITEFLRLIDNLNTEALHPPKQQIQQKSFKDEDDDEDDEDDNDEGGNDSGEKGGKQQFSTQQQSQQEESQLLGADPRKKRKTDNQEMLTFIAENKQNILAIQKLDDNFSYDKIYDLSQLLPAKAGRLDNACKAD